MKLIKFLKSIGKPKKEIPGKIIRMEFKKSGNIYDCRIEEAIKMKGYALANPNHPKSAEYLKKCDYAIDLYREMSATYGTTWDHVRTSEIIETKDGRTIIRTRTKRQELLAERKAKIRSRFEPSDGYLSTVMKEIDKINDFYEEE